MKGVILVLIVLMAVVFFPALASGQNAKSTLGFEVSRTPSTDADTKKLEERMSDALSGLIIHRPVAIDKKNTLTVNSSSANSSAANSSLINSSIASLPASGIAPGQEVPDNATVSVGTLSEGGSAGPKGVETNSKASFKGFYGITASQHEMGKNDIDSRMFLSGTFALDKSVKFQDRGI